jgi:hypothetical protein
MLCIRCKNCNRELEAHPTKTRCCGCPNMTSIRGDKISANDLSYVVLLNSEKNIKKQPLLSNDDLKYQEERRKRQVRKLDFEER